MAEGILSGLRIVEVSAFIAAPFGGAILASLGAEVIRVEQLGGGIDAKRWPLHNGQSLYRAGLDQGKRSLAVDLHSVDGQNLIVDLIASPDDNAGILVTNLPARGWMAYERLVERRPDLIMMVISGTPNGDVALDYTVNAGIGFPMITGPIDATEPVNHVLPAWDVITGALCSTALLAAERHRRLTGQGQRIDMALSDVAIGVAANLGYLAEAALVERPRQRYGNAIYGSFGRNFLTKDGRHVMVCAMTPRQWNSICTVTGLTDRFREKIEQRDEVDFREEQTRFFYRDVIGTLIEPWFQARTYKEVQEAFEKDDVLFSPYRTFKELVNEDPQAADPPASPLAFSRFSRPKAERASALGADTEAILMETLGMDREAVGALRRKGIIN